MHTPKEGDINKQAEEGLQLHVLTSISDIDEKQWDNLFASEYPFTRYAFLYALEQGGSVDSSSKPASNSTGWQALHLVLKSPHGIVAIMPAYLKQHSYGEYLFDWQFAKAYQQYQLDYYPKLISAIPFTPAQGARFAISQGYQHAAILAVLQQGTRQLINEYNLSQFQCLYTDASSSQLLQKLGYIERFDVQFQWHNNNYANFDDFLQHLTSRKRKQIRKERDIVAQQNLLIKRLTGDQLNTLFWQQFYRFYCATYLKRSGHHGYITLETFTLWGKLMANQIVVFAAFNEEVMVAASLCFYSNDTLYGRYWGCDAQFDRLHFECCYYQGIEFCIEKKLGFFDAGAQGEHKLQRGFAPVLRRGFYDIVETPLSQAIINYCENERRGIEDYIRQAQQLLPYAEK